MGGRKKWTPTLEQRQQITKLIGLGIKGEDVASIMGVSRETLYKYCKPDIDKGRPLARAKLAETAFKMALSGKYPAMTIFMCKTQLGWRDKNEADEPDPDVPQENPLLKALKQSAQSDWADYKREETNNDQRESIPGALSEHDSAESGAQPFDERNRLRLQDNPSESV